MSTQALTNTFSPDPDATVFHAVETADYILFNGTNWRQRHGLLRSKDRKTWRELQVKDFTGLMSPPHITFQDMHCEQPCDGVIVWLRDVITLDGQIFLREQERPVDETIIIITP